MTTPADETPTGRDTDPWDRQPTETDASWLAFQAFRDTDPPRDMYAFAKRYGRARSVLNAWSSKNAWRARAADYDRYRDRIERQAFLDGRYEAAKRQAALGAAMAARGGQKILSVQPQDLSVRDAISLTSEGTKIERAARGMERLEIVGSEGGPLEVYQVSQEELAARREQVEQIQAQIDAMLNSLPDGD